MLAASQEGSTRKDWWERAEQMKSKQCAVTPQNYYWMRKKTFTTEKVKNNLAVVHVFKWLELITLAGYNQSYE